MKKYYLLDGNSDVLDTVYAISEEEAYMEFGSAGWIVGTVAEAVGESLPDIGDDFVDF